ncbi:MAG TPA: type II secretion system F family protein [Bacillota bacterium]
MTEPAVAAALRWAAALLGGAAAFGAVGLAHALRWGDRPPALKLPKTRRRRHRPREARPGAGGAPDPGALDRPAPDLLTADLQAIGALAGWAPERLAAWRRGRSRWAVLGAGACLGLMLAAGRGGAAWSPWAAMLLGGGIGWWWAGHRLREAAARRQAELRRQLPSMLERYVLGVTAGLSVRQSLRLAAERTGGTLGELLGRVVARLDLGADLRRAIEPELPGVEAGPVRLVLTALMQAEHLGSSLVDTAGEQAEFVRRLASYEAERMVDALPLKLMVCAIAFLFPPIVVVVLLPNLILFLRSSW